MVAHALPRGLVAFGLAGATLAQLVPDRRIDVALVASSSASRRRSSSPMQHVAVVAGSGEFGVLSGWFGVHGPGTPPWSYRREPIVTSALSPGWRIIATRSVSTISTLSTSVVVAGCGGAWAL